MESDLEQTELLRLCRQAPKATLSRIVSKVLNRGISLGRLEVIGSATELVCREHPDQADVIRISVIILIAKRFYHELASLRI